MKLVFDLDETLYNEFDFVISGYKKVSEFYSQRLKVNFNRVFEFMCNWHELRGRDGILEGTYLNFANSELDSELKQIALDIYRNHIPMISIYPEAKVVLEKYRNTQLTLITDGNPEVQKNKIKALGIEKYFHQIYTTWSYGEDKSKPSIYCFDLAARNFGLGLTDLVYVGDDPTKDFIALNEAKGVTIRVLKGKYKEMKQQGNLGAAYTIDSIGMLPSILEEKKILIA